MKKSVNFDNLNLNPSATQIDVPPSARQKNQAKPENKQAEYQNSRVIFNHPVFLLQNFIFSQVDRSVRVSAGNIKKAFDQEVAVVEGREIPGA